MKFFQFDFGVAWNGRACSQLFMTGKSGDFFRALRADFIPGGSAVAGGSGAETGLFLYGTAYECRGSKTIHF